MDDAPVIIDLEMRALVESDLLTIPAASPRYSIKRLRGKVTPPGHWITHQEIDSYEAEGASQYSAQRRPMAAVAADPQRPA
jgi:hypothetical protein